MCRRKNICSELGADPTKWDKYSPLRTPTWMNSTVDTFVNAVDDYIRGDKNGCLDKLATINSKDITNWFIEHGQMSGRHRKITLNIPVPKSLPKELRDPIRSPARIQNEVFKRDGYKCRYCSSKLISQDFIRLLIKELNSPVFQRGETNLETHSIIHIAWPVADHVIPWNLGGRTVLTNLVSACATCNYGKDGYSIEQLGLENPFNRAPLIDNWTGLTDRIESLRTLNRF
jgi:5-methylcytosine-specific restriction endonuclease McrA